MSTSQWVSTSNAAKALGLNPVTLLRKRVQLEKDGFLKPNIHYIRTGQTKNCSYLWKLNALEELLSKWKAPKKESKKIQRVDI